MKGNTSNFRSLKKVSLLSLPAISLDMGKGKRKRNCEVVMEEVDGDTSHQVKEWMGL